MSKLENRECEPDPNSNTFECGLDMFGNYYEKNIPDQNMIIKHTTSGPSSGPISVEDPPWLRQSLQNQAHHV